MDRSARPPGRRATLNVHSILGGQTGQSSRSPCVADRCSSVFDCRFLLEEGFESTKREIEALVRKVVEASPEARFELEDLMVVHLFQTPDDSPLIAALRKAIPEVLDREAQNIASPGTSEKHVAGIGGLEHTVAYGPGILELAHQVDEHSMIM